MFVSNRNMMEKNVFVNLRFSAALYSLLVCLIFYLDDGKLRKEISAFPCFWEKLSNKICPPQSFSSAPLFCCYQNQNDQVLKAFCEATSGQRDKFSKCFALFKLGLMNSISLMCERSSSREKVRPFLLRRHFTDRSRWFPDIDQKFGNCFSTMLFSLYAHLKSEILLSFTRRVPFLGCSSEMSSSGWS